MKSKMMKVLTVAMIMAFGLVFNLSTSLEDWEATDGAAFAQSEERDSEGAFTKLKLADDGGGQGGGIVIECPPYGEDYGKCHVLHADWYHCWCHYTGITVDNCSRVALGFCNMGLGG
jgi:hypothetical protein